VELQKELVRLCTKLNQERVRYVIVGGCAVILHGYLRTTYDIDVLVDPSAGNIGRLKKALHDLFGTEEVLEIREDDIERYAVVRVAPESEEIVINLIGKIGNITFDSAAKDIQELEVEETKIPVCGLLTLIETKKGVRTKDKEDLLFLIGKKEYLEKGNSN